MIRPVRLLIAGVATSLSASAAIASDTGRSVATTAEQAAVAAARAPGLRPAAFSARPMTRFALAKGAVVLTFDDGPTPHTLEVLKVLKKYNLRAAFFVHGAMADQHPEVLAEIARQGHIVANHGMRHITRFRERATLLSELTETHERIAPHLPKGATRYYYRAPGGAWAPWRAEALNTSRDLAGYVGPIHWTVGGDDFRQNAAGSYVRAADWRCYRKPKSFMGACAEAYYRETVEKGGGVVLMHDRSPRTAQLLEDYLQLMIWRGRDGRGGGGAWRFLTLDHLFRTDRVASVSGRR